VNFDAINKSNAQKRELRPKMYEINYNRNGNIKIRRSEMFAIYILTLEKYFRNISHITNAYNSHDVRNNTRDGEWKNNDLLSDS